MGGTNGYASMVYARKQGRTEDRQRPKGKRRKLDNYETPPEHTRQLCDVIRFHGPILEPACGSGRMVRALRELTGHKVSGFDLKNGHDFLKRTRRWKGDIVTNPPYGAGMADAFAFHALELAEGRVAMLFELKFLTGTKRARKLFRAVKPEAIIIIPERVYFYAGAKQITAQFYNHCWVIWPGRARRALQYDTLTYWAEPSGEDES